VESARRVGREAMSRWSHQGFQTQHCYDAYAQAMNMLYTGDGPGAHRTIVTIWPMLEESMLMRVQTVRVHMRHARARAAVAAAGARPAEAKRLLALAEKDARAVLRERRPWSDGLGALLLASIAAARRQDAEAVQLLERAIAMLEQVDMRLYAAAARRWQGTIRGGGEGDAQVAAADAWMLQAGVKRPPAMADALSPMGRGR
jgi:eukaryotic-like serine/threonine-protein kinase